MSRPAVLDENVWILASTATDDSGEKNTDALELVFNLSKDEHRLSATVGLYQQWMRQFNAIDRNIHFPQLMTFFKSMSRSKLDFIDSGNLDEQESAAIRTRFGDGDFEVSDSAAGATGEGKFLATSDNPLRNWIKENSVDKKYNFDALPISDAARMTAPPPILNPRRTPPTL